MESAREKVRFGSFEFDFTVKELRQSGMRIRLSASQIRLLTLFLERPAVLITREEIVRALWEDPGVVDVGTGINTAVNRLRKSLNDHPEKPVYIETVIGLGYRFVARVEAFTVPFGAEKGRRATDFSTSSDRAADSAPNPVMPAPSRPIAVSGGSLVTMPPRSNAAPYLLLPVEPAPEPAPQPAIAVPPPPPQAQPIRTFWTMSWSLRVAVVLLLVATGAAVWQYRERVALKAAEQAAEIPSVDDELVLATFNDSDDPVTAEALSPQGEMFAYSDSKGVTVKWPDAHSERRIPTPPSFSVRRIAWYPDAQRLAISGTSLPTHTQQVWQLFMDGSPPRRMADDDAGADLATVSPDGKWLAYTRRRDTEIDIAAAADGSHARRLMAAGEGESFPFLLWSPASDRLVVERLGTGRLLPDGAPVTRTATPVKSLEAVNQWTYESVDAASGKLLASQDGVAFESGYVLADGRLFYPVDLSQGSVQRICVMTVPTDPHTGRLLAAPRCARRLAGGQPKSLSASSDGKEFAIVKDVTTADVFAADLRLPAANPESAKLEKPKLVNVVQVSHNAVESYPHGWTLRGDAVLFEDNTVGKTAIFEQKLDGTGKRSDARLLARLPNDAVMPEFSPDGAWVLFMELSGRPNRPDAILRVRASGGPPEQVPTTGTIEEFHCSISTRGRCVLREVVGKTDFVYYALDPVKGMGKELARTAWQPNLLGDWSVSPDGSTIAAANHDPLNPGVQLIDTTARPAKTTNLPVDGFGTVLGANWAPSQQALFVEARTQTGYSLLYAGLDGQTSLLRSQDSPVWGVPSRDGSRVAFPALTSRTNVSLKRLS